MFLTAFYVKKFLAAGCLRIVPPRCIMFATLLGMHGLQYHFQHTGITPHDPETPQVHNIPPFLPQHGMAAFIPEHPPREVSTPILVTFFAMNRVQLDIYSIIFKNWQESLNSIYSFIKMRLKNKVFCLIH